MNYLGLYWHIVGLYYRRYILKKNYEALPIQTLDLPDYTEKQHLQKSNTIWKTISPNIQNTLIETSARLQDNPIYIDLVEGQNVLVQYLPLLNALSEGMTRLMDDGVDYNFASNATISYAKKGLEELTFFQDVLYLVRHWILPYSLYKVFENYIRQFNYYGGMDIKVERQGKSTQMLPLHYNLVSPLLLIHNTHKQFLEVYWQSIKGRGFSNFYKTKYHTPFLTKEKDFEAQIKQVFDYHPAIKTVDFTLNFEDLIAEYDLLISSDFLHKYQFRNLSVLGFVCENDYTKLLTLIEKLERQQIYPRNYIHQHFGMPYIMIADAQGCPRAKVYLKSETYQTQAIIYKGQKARFTAFFTEIDESGLLIFREAILSH